MSTTFTSESVCAGHPDKICDQISDAIVDAALATDPHARVAVETLVTKDRCIMAGEVTSTQKIPFENIARDTIKKLGYTNPHFHFTNVSPVEVYIHQQSPEIAAGVDKKGAGDQGMMFGYACTETQSLMPLPIMMAHELAQRIDEVRESKKLSYLRPDGKTQVTIAYEKGRPTHIETIILAVPHEESIDLQEVKNDLINTIVNPVVKKNNIPFSNHLIVNGTGVWHIGGPASDTGVTGRKIIVDTYGGYARVGGGAFSGKDPTKVDRSGAYAARFIAKNVVAVGLAERAEVRLAYCIGVEQPVMQDIETFGTEKKSKKIIRDFMSKLLDTSVYGIIEYFKLQRPLYEKTAAYGHFGRALFPWEKITA